MSEWVRAAKKRDLEPGKGVMIEAGGRRVALFNADGVFYAVDDACPHRGGPLSQGAVDNGELTCPWHAWGFDVKTGACHTVPAAKIRTYPVKTEGDDVFVQI